jgi:hypothetical protein
MQEASASAWASMPASRRLEALEGQITGPDGPMQVQVSSRWGLPSFIGGPGFGVGSYDLSASPIEILSALFGEFNFLGLTDPETELEVWRDIHGPALRTLIFRQQVDGLPIWENRLIFVFERGTGRMIHFSGHYVPPNRLLFGHTMDCSALLGTWDDHDYTIESCEPIYSVSEARSGVPGDDIQPVFRVTAWAPSGMERVTFLSETTGEHYQIINRWADRILYRGYPSWDEYYWNESCVWPGGCPTNVDLSRLRDDLWYYTAYMAIYNSRNSWDADSSTTPYRLRVRDPGPSVPISWDGTYVNLDTVSRLSTLAHEWSHAVMGEEAPGTNGTVGEGLADTFANIILATSNHWCYHNYPGWSSEPECIQTHVEDSRCTMLGGDTVGDLPWRSYSIDIVESLMAGLVFNFTNPATHLYEASGIFTKVFELFQVDRWLDPNQGTQQSDPCGRAYRVGSPVTYYNGVALSGAVTFGKVNKLWYRFVTQHLAALGSKPWSSFGVHFQQAAWNAYLDSDLTYTEYGKAISAMYAVGHRQAPITISGHYGSQLRQAAVYKGGQIYLFYARTSDGKIFYQKGTGGSWNSPVGFASSAITDKGLDAYELTSGEVRVIFKYKNSNSVYYVRINPDGTVPTAVYAGPCGLTTSHAPAGIHDGTRELIATTNGSQARITRTDTCVTQTVTSVPPVNGVALAKHHGVVYWIGQNLNIWSGSFAYNIVARGVSTTPDIVPIGGPDGGYITCAHNYVNPDWPYNTCVSAYSAAGTTPNLYAVVMPSGRTEFERLYYTAARSSSEFALHRFDVNTSGGYTPTKRTRILPVESVNQGATHEPELVQAGGMLYLFEDTKTHILRVYY